MIAGGPRHLQDIDEGSPEGEIARLLHGEPVGIGAGGA
jgi:hypothetical protein